MKLSPKAQKAWSIASGVLVSVVVILAILLAGARIIGLQPYNVLSGSMEPTYSEGDLIYVKKASASSVKVGDPITFVLNEDLVVATHRVVEIDWEKQCFYTQGDAMDHRDGAPVHFNNLVGVPVFSLPWLGYVSDFIQTSPGMYIAIGTIVLLVAAVFLPDLIKKKSAPSKEETQ